MQYKLEVGETLDLHYKTDADALEDQGFLYVIEEAYQGVATVDEDGVITAVAPGTAPVRVIELLSGAQVDLIIVKVLTAEELEAVEIEKQDLISLEFEVAAVPQGPTGLLVPQNLTSASQDEYQIFGTGSSLWNEFGGWQNPNNRYGTVSALALFDADQSTYVDSYENYPTYIDVVALLPAEKGLKRFEIDRTMLVTALHNANWGRVYAQKQNDANSGSANNLGAWDLITEIDLKTQTSIELPNKSAAYKKWRVVLYVHTGTTIRFQSIRLLEV